jgi:hypothetical protein
MKLFDFVTNNRHGADIHREKSPQSNNFKPAADIGLIYTERTEVKSSNISPVSVVDDYHISKLYVSQQKNSMLYL